MELKIALSSFTDRELLELLVCNQVWFERRLERIEAYLSKKSGQESKELQPYLADDYWTAPHEKAEGQPEHSVADTFKELVKQSTAAKHLINSL